MFGFSFEIKWNTNSFCCCCCCSCYSNAWHFVRAPYKVTFWNALAGMSSQFSVGHCIPTCRVECHSKCFRMRQEKKVGRVWIEAEQAGIRKTKRMREREREKNYNEANFLPLSLPCRKRKALIASFTVFFEPLCSPWMIDSDFRGKLHYNEFIQAKSWLKATICIVVFIFRRKKRTNHKIYLMQKVRSSSPSSSIFFTFMLFHTFKNDTIPRKIQRHPVCDACDFILRHI